MIRLCAFNWIFDKISNTKVMHENTMNPVGWGRMAGGERRTEENAVKERKEKNRNRN